jgi:putative tricarboxylic transport membrane protein
MDARRDLLIAVAVACLGLGILVMTGSIRMGIARDVVGPRAVPYLIGGFLLVAGLVLAARRARRMNPGGGFVVPGEGTADEEGHPASAGRVGIIMALSAAYAALLVPLGYLIVTPAFVVLAFVATGERRWGFMIAIAAVWTVVTYVAFAQILSVRMPVGPFAPLFRELGLITL